MAAERESEIGKLHWWIMGVLLTLAMAGGGWWARDLQQRFDTAAVSWTQRYETLNQTNALRGERMVALETKLASVEPRVNATESKLGVIEPRLPLVEARLTALDGRLQRIDDKLDQITQRLVQGKGGGR